MNKKLQGGNHTLVSVLDILAILSHDINSWIESISLNIFKAFPLLDSLDQKSNIKTTILQHLKLFKKYLKSYIPDTLPQLSILVQNPFKYDVNNIEDEVMKREFIGLYYNTPLKTFHGDNCTGLFWIEAYKQYKNLGSFILKLLLPFATTYLCEASFSAMLFIKSKTRNRIDPVPQMRLALTEILPEFDKLAKEKQSKN